MLIQFISQTVYNIREHTEIRAKLYRQVNLWLSLLVQFGFISLFDSILLSLIIPLLQIVHMAYRTLMWDFTNTKLFHNVPVMNGIYLDGIACCSIQQFPHSTSIKTTPLIKHINISRMWVYQHQNSMMNKIIEKEHSYLNYITKKRNQSISGIL